MTLKAGVQLCADSCLSMMAPLRAGMLCLQWLYAPQVNPIAHFELSPSPHRLSSASLNDDCEIKGNHCRYKTKASAMPKFR